MFSIHCIVMDILQCRVKCVVYWRGGRERSFSERTGQPLRPHFEACTVCSIVYCAVQHILNPIIYSIVCSKLYSRVFRSKGTRGKPKIAPQGLGHICLSLCCLCRGYHQVQWTAQCTVKFTVQCTVKCSVQCTLYY